MKARREIITGIVSGVAGMALGWAAGYLRLPYIEINSSILPWVFTCLALVCCVIFLIILRRKNSLSAPKISVGMILLFILAIGGFAGSFFMYRQNAELRTQLRDRDKNIRELSDMLAFSGSGELAPLMDGILSELDHNLKLHPGDVLNDTIINKLKTLSLSFQPRKFYAGDSLTEKKISPERGQLLIGLILLDIDSASFDRIKRAVTFSGANLFKADLHGADLRNADLSGVYLKEANLSGANLSEANLSDADLWGAKLDTAILMGTDLKRTDLRWAQFNGANMREANMNGAKMSGAQFIKADLYKAFIQWADMSGVMLNNADFQYADLMGTVLQKTNFHDADLSHADLRLTNLKEADLSNTRLHKAIVDSTWNNKLPELRITGAREIHEAYELENDTADQWKNPLFRLIEKE